jgi:hypothetical protein
LKRLKVLTKVLQFLIGIDEGLLLFYKLSPFFSDIYRFIAFIYDLLIGAVEWIVDAFARIAEYFGIMLEMFEDLPDISEVFFLPSSWI